MIVAAVVVKTVVNGMLAVELKHLLGVQSFVVQPSLLASLYPHFVSKQNIGSVVIPFAMHS